MDREQIKKELGLFISDNPVELHLHHKKTSSFLAFLQLVLDVITTDEQKIFELENRLKECENGYEGTLYLERCKLHDAEEKIKKLTEENERLITELETRPPKLVITKRKKGFPSNSKEWRKQYRAEQYKRRKAEGRCTTCGNTLTPQCTTVSCERCLAKQKVYQWNSKKHKE